MESICPKCGKHIEHDDFLFEVLCECGSRFNPFLLLEEKEKAAGAEPSAMSEGAAAGAENYAESAQAFQEITTFGENSGSPAGSDQGMGAGEAGVPGGAPAPAAAKAAPRAPRPPAAPLAEGDECPMTAGDTLPGYQVEGYFMPVSSMISVDSGAESPMKPALESLWSQAQASGGNGIVSLRWTLSTDSTKVLVTGTPVRISKG